MCSHHPSGTDPVLGAAPIGAPAAGAEQCPEPLSGRRPSAAWPQHREWSPAWLQTVCRISWPPARRWPDACCCRLTCSRVRWFESQKIDHFCLFLRPSASPSYLLLQFLSILHEKLLGILGRSFRVYPTIREFTYANIHGGDSSEKRTPLWNHGSSQDWKFYMILKAIYMIENWTLILYKSTENLMQSFYSSLKGSFTPFSLLTMAVTSWHFSASVVPQPNNQPLCRVLYIVFECALLACYCACVICCDMGVTSALESSC